MKDMHILSLEIMITKTLCCAIFTSYVEKTKVYFLECVVVYLLCMLHYIVEYLQSFTELIELASQGDASELHVTAKHMLSGAGDVYDQVPGEFMVYSFGQAMSRDKGKWNRP